MRPCSHLDLAHPDSVPHPEGDVTQGTVVALGAYILRKKLHLTVTEIGGAIAVWRGIADWNFPASLVIAGVAVIVAVELRG